MAVVPASSSSRAAGRPPGLFYGVLRVFDLSVAPILWSRRTVFMALIVGLPVVIAAGIRLLSEFGAPMRMGRTPAGGALIFGLMMWGFFVRFCVPVLAIFYGTALIADEVDDKTITYLFTRPIPRGAVLLGKYLAYLVSTVAVVLPAVVCVWLLVAPINGALATSFPDFVKDLGILALGLTAYGAVFALAGTVLKRPLVFGLVFVFGWETLVMALPGYFKRLSVAFYLQGLVPHALPADSPMAFLQSVFRESPSITVSLTALAVITIGCLWLGARAIGRREYVLEQ